MKDIFNYLGHLIAPKPQRFIDIDGRPWFKKTFLDKRDPAIVIGGALALSSIFFAAAHAPEGDAAVAAYAQTIGSALVFGGATFITNFMNEKLSYKLYSFLISPVISPAQKLGNYAIDTHGRSTSPYNTPNLLLTVKDYKNNCHAALFATTTTSLGAVLACTLTPITYSQILIAAPTLVIPFIKFGGNYIRCKKLLSGEYTFCGTPPTETKKAEVTIWKTTKKPSFA